ncbi:hypothetical protein IWQ60_001079 [Tieghemiomyces parasiticus]|uniref:Transcription factor domain-containing protein n=1 Tax=Tieghemiomyces parasiticus TaxID=78921 RepID=A0A9W8AKG9_9FUNG|nr:hypothetical protein IWQ60_001079 [Tieghemiomyces parasiticus]
MPCMATLRARHQRSGEVGHARSARSVLIRLVEEYPASNASRINPYISLSPSSSDPLSSPLAETSSAPHRALFNDTDLLFHSEILRYGLYQFAQRAYGQFGDLHYYRAITRLQRDVMPSELQLIIALLCSPLSEYESFHHIPQVVIINLYRNHLRQSIVRFIEERSADALTVLFTTAEYCLGLGAYSESVLAITTAIRKLQVMRVHLIDQSPPPPPLPDSSFDATRLRNPLLIDHFRIVWWIAITRDAHNAVTFGLRPVVRLDEFQVVYPEGRLIVPPPDFTAAASHDGSDINTSPDYPTYFLPFFEYASTRINCALSRLLHLVATARYHFRHDVTRWLRYWRRACQALERWRATSQSLIKVTHGHTIPSLDADVPVAPRKLTNHELLDGHQYYMLLIYLHHLDGVLPTPPNVGCYASSSKPAFSDEAWDGPGEDQFGGTSDRDTDDDDYMYSGLTDTMAIQPNTSSSRSSGDKDHESGSGTTEVPGAILRICDQRCWEAVLDLRQYMSHSIGVVDSYYNTLLLGTLYGAGVVCIEVLHGRRQVSDVAAARTLAAAFLEEIIVLLTHSSEFNPSDLRVVASLQKLRDNPPAMSCYYTLTLEHLQ